VTRRAILWRAGHSALPCVRLPQIQLGNAIGFVYQRGSRNTSQGEIT
jgi:hypothetical protein